MAPRRSTTAFVTLAYFSTTFALGVYFALASVQGDFGILQRHQVDAETETLEAQLADLTGQVAHLRLVTRRISDRYLDLDLLDEQVRWRLGLLRADELVVQ